MVTRILSEYYDLLEVESDDLYLSIHAIPQHELWDFRFLFNVKMKYKGIDASFQWHSDYLSGPENAGPDDIAELMWHAWVSMFYVRIRKYIRKINGAT